MSFCDSIKKGSIVVMIYTMELYLWQKKKNEQKRKKDRRIVDFIMIQTHFFRDMQKWIEEMEDSRNER